MKKVVLALVVAFGAVAFAREPQIKTEDLVFEQIDAPQAKLSKNWMFIYDNSHSMRGVFAKARLAFQEATKYPSDELNFNIISFNNESAQDIYGWSQASTDEFDRASKWVNKHAGILSYGCKAFEMALQSSPYDGGPLTIIVISDGGFTEGFPRMRESIAKGQAWRRDHGLGDALIVSIGIENKWYRAGHKPPDEVCQTFMREIGHTGGGGYFFVHEPAQAVVGKK